MGCKGTMMWNSWTADPLTGWWTFRSFCKSCKSDLLLYPKLASPSQGALWITWPHSLVSWWNSGRKLKRLSTPPVVLSGYRNEFCSYYSSSTADRRRGRGRGGLGSFTWQKGTMLQRPVMKLLSSKSQTRLGMWDVWIFYQTGWCV